MQCPVLACVPHMSWHMHAGRSGLSCAIFVFADSVCVFLCVCVSLYPGEVDDVLDSVCAVHNS